VVCVLQERLEQLQDENEELRQQLAALQDDLDEASRQRPGTSGMSSALRQQVLTLQVSLSLR
jgi:cell division septum initiation protein DivIVA